MIGDPHFLLRGANNLQKRSWGRSNFKIVRFKSKIAIKNVIFHWVSFRHRDGQQDPTRRPKKDGTMVPPT